MRLTDMTVKTLAIPEQSQRVYFDDGLPGFGCRVGASGSRTFIVVHGRSRQTTTIGRYPMISLSQARQRAKEILAEQVLGKTRAPSHVAFGAAVERFLDTHGGRQTTVREYRRILSKHFIPKLKLEPLERIRTPTLVRIIDGLSNTPSEGRHAQVILGVFFNWAVSRRIIEHSPLSGIKLPKAGRARERVLTDEELAEVLRQSETRCTVGWIVRLLLLTGQRRGEIGGLRRSYIDRKAKTITWPGEVVKNRRSHMIPFGPMVDAILDEVPNEGDLLFPARGSDDKPFCGWSKAGLGFTKACGTAPWTLHDLRRTFASGMQRLGVRIEVTEKLLNHVSGSFSGITGVYHRHTYAEEMREAVGLWERHITNILDRMKPVQ